VVDVVSADGHRRIDEADVAQIADAVIAGRLQRPDGPNAPLI
jgi:proteasome beta subunit